MTITREEAISRIQRALNVPNRLQGLVLIDEESANMAIEALQDTQSAKTTTELWSTCYAKYWKGGDTK